MKTAISVPDEIFREIDKFAEERNCSRSEVFVMAVREFLEKMKSRQLLELLNEAHEDIETAQDIALRKKAVRHYAKKVLRDPY